jgi:hypothetical protein
LTTAVNKTSVLLPAEILKELLVDKSMTNDKTWMIHCISTGAENSHYSYVFVQPLMKIVYVQAPRTHTCFSSALANFLVILAQTKERGKPRQLLLEETANIINTA